MTEEDKLEAKKIKNTQEIKKNDFKLDKTKQNAHFVLFCPIKTHSF